MSRTFTCPNLHRFNAEDAAPRCPVCGERGKVDDATAPPGDVSVMMSQDAASPSGALSASNARVGSFLIVRSHARGGLGLVSVAHDPSLNRDVALKQMRPEVADDVRSRHRFINEAEITGQLEHPGIVPVYAIGHDSDGRPFYAMKFVHGRTLADAIAEHHRQPTYHSLRELLRRFVSVCQAIAYAHSKGVIHRDLKPSNIMLGEFGEQLILDWGLAKRLRDNSHRGEPASARGTSPDEGAAAQATLDGQILGTPMYMSPEQATGDVAKQNAATDVYSLGAILYHILAGQPALQGHTNEQIVTKLKSNETLPPPRTINRSVDRALEAICIKAMSADPNDRYTTAAELADEIDRWAGDEPVRAYREPIVARAARLTRRHRSIVVGGAAVIAVLLLGVIGTSIQTVRATRAQHQADAQRALAEKRFAEVRTLANRFMFDFHAKIAELPGSTPAVKLLVGTSLEYLQKLSADAGGDLLLQSELAAAYQKVGDIQGNPNNANLGDTRGAIESYSKSIEITRRLADAPGADDRALRALGVSIGRLADLRATTGDTSGALKDFGRVNEMFSQLAEKAPSVTTRRDLAVSNIKQADLFKLTGDRAAATRGYQRAAELFTALAADEPNSTSAQRDLAVIMMKLGDFQLEQEDFASAAGQYQRSLDIHRRLAKENPENAMSRREMAISLERLALALEYRGQLAESIRHYQEALDCRENLVADDPADLQALRELRICLDNFANSKFARGDLNEAEPMFRRALDIATKLRESNTADVDLQRAWAVAKIKVGQCLIKRNDPVAALREYTDALKLLGHLHSADESNIVVLRELGSVHGAISDLHFAADEFILAAESGEQCLAFIQKWAAADRTVSAQREVVVSHVKVADALLGAAESGDNSAQIAQCRRAVEQLTAAKEVIAKLLNGGVAEASVQDLADEIDRLNDESRKRLAKLQSPASAPS